jgi:hypothetical protein
MKESMEAHNEVVTRRASSGQWEHGKGIRAIIRVGVEGRSVRSMGFQPPDPKRHAYARVVVQTGALQRNVIAWRKVRANHSCRRLKTSPFSPDLVEKDRRRCARSA